MHGPLGNDVGCYHHNRHHHRSPAVSFGSAIHESCVHVYDSNSKPATTAAVGRFLLEEYIIQHEDDVHSANNNNDVQIQSTHFHSPPIHTHFDATTTTA
mmetsp:Transcript_17455/g.32726  ORF Transcript_17455/g.32726 Transcript_17455/m.32726 type:complete len:99 (-) Transcript_17455:2774-3070(-)